MKKFCILLALIFSATVFLSPGFAEARAHHGLKHHPIAKKNKHVHHIRHGLKRAASRHRLDGSVSLNGVTPVLASKARDIVVSCGSVVISAISARRNHSNHPSGRAVDLRGNPGCIYAHLRNWPGGYSTDYRSVRHVHVSYNPGGQEWGLRFAHHGHSHHRAIRYASRDSRRQVSPWRGEFPYGNMAMGRGIPVSYYLRAENRALRSTRFGDKDPQLAQGRGGAQRRDNERYAYTLHTPR